jgi:putative secretion ATPase (PEP-CTERM system associated)
MYEDFYKFTGKPFQLNPDPAFFFGSKGHSKAYAYLKYGVYQGEGFIVISGEIGAGKTTLVRALLEELDSETVVAAQLVSTQLEADDLLRAVATSFSIPLQPDKSQLLTAIEAYLTQLVVEGKRALLLVDEAQNLTPRALEELRMLSNFQIGERGLLQSFLVGQPELRNILRAPSLTQLRQRILTSYHLGPMEEPETRAYIEHRLHHVGWESDPQIEDDVYKLVHQATGGLPRKINTLCNRLLLSSFLAEKHLITVSDVQQIIKEFASELTMSETTPEDARAAAAAGANGANGANGAHAGDMYGQPAGRGYQTSALSARLDRIEAKLDQLTEMLRGGAQPGTADRSSQQASRQPRFGARAVPPRSS